MKKVVIVLLFFILMSCDKNSSDLILSPKEYKNWIKENLKKFEFQKELGGLDFTLTFIPKEAYVLKEFNELSEIDANYYKLKYSKLDGLIACNLRISPSKGTSNLLDFISTDASSYGQVLNYFTSEAQKDFYLTQGNDTFKCKMYHFENTYGLQMHNSIAMLFDAPTADNGDFEFVFNDQILNIGNVIFNINTNEMYNTPKIELNK